jgi:thiol-disulfide isomerase/thioredoxin
MMGLGVLAATTTLLWGRMSVSPAPDMPAEWFWHSDDAQAAKHRELIGKPAPELQTAKWFQGELTQDSMKGKVVLLDLWATWCGPCKVAMPHTDEMAKKYADKGLVVAAICSDGDEAFVPKFIEEKKLSMPMAWDKDGATFKAYAGQWFPTYVLIDKKGTVRAIGLTSDAVEKAVEKLLAE